MESYHCKIGLILICCLLGFSCSNNSREDSSPDIDYSIFQNGDIICRLGNGMFSNLFRKNSKEKLYSHAGIVHTVNDSVYIIHAEASELTGIGFVKEEAISIFLKDVKTWGLYRLNQDSLIRDDISKHALSYFINKTRFDMDFDYSNDNKVYCTELVALSINKSLNDTIISPSYRIKNRLFITVDDIYLNPNFNLVYKTDK